MKPMAIRHPKKSYPRVYCDPRLPKRWEPNTQKSANESIRSWVQRQGAMEVTL